MKNITNIKHADSGNFFLIAGPCVVESEENVFEIACTIKEITNRLKIPFIFKASYRKANRSRLDSFTGIGDEKALKTVWPRYSFGISFHAANEGDEYHLLAARTR